MCKINTFFKAFIMLLIMSISSATFGQNISFSASKASNIEVGEIINLTNTSTNIPENVTFTWEFENCSFVIDSVLYCEYTTTSLDNIDGFFTNYDTFNITLSAKDEEGNVIGSSQSLTFILNPPTACGTTCHDSLPFSCTNSNLVCNPSFEYINQNVTLQGQLYFAEPWCNLGSSDQYQPGMTPAYMPWVNNMGVPSNTSGYQQPHSGSMYSGLLTLTTTHYNTGYVPSNQNEYMAVPVKTAVINSNPVDHLIEGQRYGVSFYFSRGDNCKFSTDGVHAYLSSNMLATGGQNSAQWTIHKPDSDPNFLHPFDNYIITDNSSWTHFYQEYIPSDNTIKYLTLGYFRSLSTSDINTHYEYTSSNPTMPVAYYYIDDVSLTPLPPLVTVNSPTSLCDSVELTVSGIGAGHYLWSTGAITSSITVAPNTTTTYTVTVTDYYDCNPVVLQSIVTVASTTTPIISGYQNNCDSLVLYSIENFDTNYTYTWSTQVFDATNNQYSTGSFTINGNTNVETANTASINWNSATFPILPNYVVITVEATLKGSNCSSISMLKVYECCEGDMGQDGLYWHDTTFTSTQSIQGIFVSINGTVTLKDSLLINTISGNGGIWFGPYAKIILDSGGYFEMNTGSLKGACEYMWDGVYASTTNEVVKLYSVNVENAINGIVSEHGAPLYLDSCYFDNNLRSVQIKNYRRTSLFQNPLYYSGYVRGCSFNSLNGDPNYPSNYYSLWAPHQNDPSECGIFIENVENIQIGDPNALKNTFNRSRFGIMSYNSALKVFNNEFRYINDVTNTGWFSFVQGAVFVSNINTSFPSVGYSKAMELGKAGNNGNDFIHCHTGLFANNTIAKISNNSVDYCNVGFRVLDFKYHSRIDSNEINHTIEGILVHKPIGSYRNLKVRENNMPYSSELKTGISLINVSTGLGDTAQIANNTIRFLGNTSANHYGIITNNCNLLKVNSNNIGRGGVSLGDIANNWDKMVGIKTAQSQGCQITDNYIYSMGTGIWTNGSCNLTQYSCNDLIAYKYGFYFGQLTTITEQGHLGTWNTHNKWSTSGAIASNEKLATDAAFNNFNWNGTVKWYYGPNYVSQYIPISLGLSPKIEAAPNNTDSHYCVGTSTGTGTSTGGGSPTGGGTNSGTLAMLEDENIDPEVRDFLLEDMMQGLDYIDLLNEFRAYDAKFLYEMLATDTALMWLGGENDIDYQEFFDSVRMSNIGDFTKVYDFIEAEDYHRADSMNNLIESTSNIYSNLKTVLSIYLSTWCKGVYHLSESDYNTLFEIANQTPYEGGDGVYTARIMINYNPDDYGVAFRLKPESVNDTDKDAIKLYPNPAQDMLNIEFENPKGEAINGVLKVFNLSGKLIFEKQLNTNNAFYMLDISQLTNGAYIFSIQINNKENTAYRHQSGKLIVLKP